MPDLKRARAIEAAGGTTVTKSARSGTLCGTRSRGSLATSHLVLRAALLLCLELVVDLATVCDIEDEDEDLVVVNICEDSVIADPVTPEFFVDELFTELARIIQLGELLLKKITDPFRDGRVEFPDLFRCLRGESDRVAHAGQTTSARSIASSLD